MAERNDLARQGHADDASLERFALREGRRVLKGGPAIGVDGRTCGETLYCGNHTPKA